MPSNLYQPSHLLVGQGWEHAWCSLSLCAVMKTSTTQCFRLWSWVGPTEELNHSQCSKSVACTHLHSSNSIWHCPASRASLVAQTVNNLPAMQETWVQSLGREDPLEKGMATTLVLLSRKSHGQRSLADYSPWVPKSQIWLSKWHNSTPQNALAVPKMTFKINQPYLIIHKHDFLLQ